LLRKTAPRDALATSLERRTSYRGLFQPAQPDQSAALDSCIIGHGSVAMALPRAASAQIAGWHDRATFEAFANSAFTQELYRWMRFSLTDPSWERDGLSADCLALSKLEARAAMIALRPAVVKVLSALSLTRFFVSEAAQTESATRIVVIHQASGGDTFYTGRAWYRFWLALDRADLGGVPMSALRDSSRYSRKLLDAYPLPEGREFMNLMRLGPRPVTGLARSARLPSSELLLEGKR
jgi:hypothetical protein